MDLRRVLAIAGSDSSGGAGIQADLKTIAAHGLYGESAVTALTAQNTCGVSGVLDVPPAFVAQQIDAVFADIRPDAVKIGMVSTPSVARAVAERLVAHGAEHVVVDPVMTATSGAGLMADGTARALVERLFPLAQLVTPNIPEASVLAGFDAGGSGVASMVAAARAVAELTPGCVLVKGGHLEGADAAADVLLVPGCAEPLVLRGTPVDTANAHGTGCTLSSAIACNLARGLDVACAVREAKRYLEACLRAGLDLGRGSGPLDHMAPLRSRLTCGFGPAAEQSQACGAVGAAGDAEQPQACDSLGADGLLAARDPLAARRVLVVGGSPERPDSALLRRLAGEVDLVVACDGGADPCYAAGVSVDVLIGDADSASSEALAFARRTALCEAVFPMEKDDVDLGLAVAWVRSRCPQVRELVFTGVSGGRTDHALAALGIVARAADLAPVIEENDAVMRVLSPDGRARWAFAPDDVGRTASVVALEGEAVVSERGMRWNLDYAPLAPLDDLGVSNVVQDEGACVEVHEGAVLVCLLRDRIVKESRSA